MMFIIILMNKQKQIKRIQFRNATYYGEVINKNIRHGYGLLVTDNSEIVLAQWTNNEIAGPYVYLGNKIRAYGRMKNTKLQGFNVILTNHSAIERQAIQTQSIFGMFRQNIMYGSCVLLNEDEAYIGQLVNGQVQIPFTKLDYQELQSTLNQTFPRNILQLTQFLKQLQIQNINKQKQKNQVTKFVPVLTKIDENSLFYGYSQPYRDKKYGFVMREHQLLSVGQFQNGNVQGLARMYKNDGIVEDGVFCEGQLKGIGVRYWKSSNKHIFGDFQQNQAISKGFSWPSNLINQFRQEFHLRSLHYHSNQVMLNFVNIMQNTLQEVFKNLNREKEKTSMGESQNNYFSTKDLITTNRGRNLTITDRNYGSMKEKSRSKNRYEHLNKNRNFSPIQESVLEYEDHNPKKIDLFRESQEESNRKRNRTWNIKK